MIPRATPSGLMIDNVLSISHNSFKWIFDPRCDTKRASSSQHRDKYFRFFSNLVGEEVPRIPGVKDSRVCFLKTLSALLTFFLFLRCLFLVYPIYFFQLNLNPHVKEPETGHPKIGDLGGIRVYKFQSTLPHGERRAERLADQKAERFNPCFNGIRSSTF